MKLSSLLSRFSFLFTFLADSFVLDSFLVLPIHTFWVQFLDFKAKIPFCHAVNMKAKTLIYWNYITHNATSIIANYRACCYVRYHILLFYDVACSGPEKKIQ